MSSENDKRRVGIIVAGAAGRMGRRLIALAGEDRRFSLSAAVEHVHSEEVGKDAGELAGIGRSGIPVQDHTETEFDVLIDFSVPAGTMHWLDFCIARRRAFITGVTGLGAAQLAAIEKAAREIPVLAAPNMSLGVNLMLRLVREAAGVLRDYDVEIVESHHRFKRDAPSGTAQALLEAVRTGRDAREAQAVHGRHGGALDRPAGEIGMHSLRAGDIVGEHEVILSGLGETLTVGHRAHSRDTFVRGALCAAAWIADRPPGLYSMSDVLFGA